MRLRFAGQPFANRPNLMDFIEHTRDHGFDELRIAVAWAKRSGLGRAWDALEEFRSNGGRVLLILGVSEGGATKEGLELALRIADQAYVFHDPQRTFHPKVYFSSSATDGRSLLIGSSNLTAGGLGWNYEASMWVDLEPGEGEELTDELSAWFDGLIAEASSCIPLTADLISDLEQSATIFIGSENRARRPQGKQSDTPEDNDSPIATTISGLFDSVPTGLRQLPGLSATITAAAAPGSSATTPTESPASAASPLSAVQPPAIADPAPLPTDDVKRRWIKRLDNTAAQQVRSAGSNPTGNLRLSREIPAIDQTIYFRGDFFGDLPWAPTPGKESEQEVFVMFNTWIDGTDFGVQELRVSHDPVRISGQGNVPTVLHWGVLAPELRATSYVGLYISLERTIAGGYNLVISQAARGDYLV